MRWLRSRSIGWVRHPCCHWLPTFFTQVSILLLAYLISQWNSVSIDTSLRPSGKGSSKSEKESRFCLDRFPWSGPFSVDFASKSLRLQAFLKGLGTKRACSKVKRFASLNYAGRLLSLSGCTRWKSLRRLNEHQKVWIFAISYPNRTLSMHPREAEGRNKQEPWVYGCVLSFLFWSTDKDASSWFLVAHGWKTYQKSFQSSFFSLPIQRDRRKIACYLMYGVASFRQLKEVSSCLWQRKEMRQSVEPATNNLRMLAVHLSLVVLLCCYAS